MARSPVRWPMSRPALPRASSAMSGFFFCGSIDEPVANASGSRRKPNSSLDQSTTSSPIRERCTWVSAAAKSASATKSRSDTASSEFSNRAANPSVGGDAGRDRAAGSNPRARRHRAARRRPASTRPASARRRGRAPRSARAGGARAAPAARAAGACSRGGRRRRRTRRRGAPAPPAARGCARRRACASRRTQRRRSSGDLVVAAPAGVELGAGGARELGDPALDRGVDVLVGRRERERAVVQLDADAVERVARSRTAPSSVSSPTDASMATCAREPARSSWREALVERQADGERHAAPSAGPSPNRPCQSGRASSAVIDPTRDRSIRTGRRAPRCAGARPRLDREAPEPHESGGVLVAERVVGFVGGEVVVVEAALGAAAGHEAPARLEPQPHLAGDVALGRVDERVERLAQRREPQAVVDELRVARLEAGLLPHHVALERDRLEVGVGEHHRQRYPGTRRSRGS